MPTIHSKFNPNILPSCEKVYIWYNQLDSSDESGGDESLIDINAEEANSALPSIYFGLSIAPVLFCKCVNNEPSMNWVWRHHNWIWPTYKPIHIKS